MLAEIAHARTIERMAARTVTLPDGVSVSLTLTIRLETPGECCADIASTLAFAYDPPLPDDVAVRLDDRLYDGIYVGLAEAPGALPPDGLKVAITAVRSDPPLSAVVSPPNWARIGSLGDALGALSSEAFSVALAELQQQMP